MGNRKAVCMELACILLVLLATMVWGLQGMLFGFINNRRLATTPIGQKVCIIGAQAWPCWRCFVYIVVGEPWRNSPDWHEKNPGYDHALPSLRYPWDITFDEADGSTVEWRATEYSIPSVVIQQGTEGAMPD